MTIDGPDYEELGSHFGFHGQRVEKAAELKGALQGALAATKARQDRDPQRGPDPVAGGPDCAQRNPGASLPHGMNPGLRFA